MKKQKKVKMSDVALGVSCKGLKKADLMSKSDPFVVFFILDTVDNKGWVEMGRTETIKNNLDPVFKLAFRVRIEARRLVYTRHMIRRLIRVKLHNRCRHCQSI